MNMNGILPLASPAPIASPTLAGSIMGAGSSSFGEYVKTAVESLDRTQKNAEFEIGRAGIQRSPRFQRHQELGRVD